MSTGELVSISLRGPRSRTQTVRLSANLVSHVRPVCVVSPSGPADPVFGAKRSFGSGLPGEEDTSCPIKRSADESTSAKTSTAALVPGDPISGRISMALVDGMLVSRDADSDCPVVLSPTGIPCCNLTDSVTVFWLPMDARIGPDELPQFVRRCCTPRLAICLPFEVAMKVVSFDDDW
ncbi:unnamed protein product [Echinostoma caproni]|uniref:DUF1263 domain-containing protein n=1 Tax=Echinostoma caproni TaxID=27848 RepID=A0A183AE19_9TREM|nr:unnamed protein product [Echinostoma caproni]